MTANLLVGYEFMNRKSANGRNLSVRMNYTAASSGVLKTKTLNAPKGGELTPCPPLAGLSF
jgi:hypothetical protein